MYRQLEKKISRFHIMEYRDTDSERKRENAGSAGNITLEASIFLVLFILFYMALMDLVQIARAQVILQYSINEVAKEVSQCSYVLTKAGFVDKRLETAGRAEKFEGHTAELVDAVERLGNTISNGDVGGAMDAAENAGNLADAYFADMDELALNILSLVKREGSNIASEFVIQQLVKSNVKKQLENMTSKDADTYLKDLGISGGFESLQFDRSNWCQTSSGSMPDLEVTVVYEIDFNLGVIELEPRTFKLTAKTALW